MAGDLTSDGHAAFWHRALEAIPEFRAEREAVRQRLGVTTSRRFGYETIPRSSLDDYHIAIDELEQRYTRTEAFLVARKRLHVDKFYAFLRHAGRFSTVLVVKGDHDDDFAGDYDCARINAIPGCREISGETVTVGRAVFLGLGFPQCGFRRPLRQFIQNLKDRVDVVIAHPPHRNVCLVSELNPRLLIRGHFGGGRYLINGVPTVFTSSAYAVIDLRRTQPPLIRTAGESWERLYRKRYEWLSAYPRAASR